MESAITQHYTEAGYINSGAVIPAEQSLMPDAAVVVIEIIEGELEAIKVTIDGRLTPEYVRSRLAIATEKRAEINKRFIRSTSITSTQSLN